jgi:hypothetical protein
MDIEQIYTQMNEQQGILVSLLNSKTTIPPNKISDVCMKLSVLNGLLGSKIADLKQKQIESEKSAFALAKEKGRSDTAAKEVMRFASIIARKNFEKADTKHTDTWKLISMAQTHIGALRDESKGL